MIAYTVATAAEATSLSQRTIRRAIAAGNLAARYSGKRILISAKELEDWVNSLPSERVS